MVEVRRPPRGPQVLISRTHPGLVKRLFELEVPEIYDGTVEIKSIAREAGSRTKMAVWSADRERGPHRRLRRPQGRPGGRPSSPSCGGEKIDIIKYSEDPAEFIAAALAPPTCWSVQPADEGKSCRVIVPDDQLSLAIGKEGQNARLAAKLTGYKIDIKPASAPGGLPGRPESRSTEESGATRPRISLPARSSRRERGDVPAQKDPHAPVCRLPGDETETGADPGGPLPRGAISLDFTGKKPGPGRLSVPRPGVPEAGAEVQGAGAGLLHGPSPDEVYEALEAPDGGWWR